MCNALGSRTDPSRRSAFGQVASSFAEVWESPLANRRDVVAQARPVPRSASAPPVRCRHTAWAEQPPSAEQPARCAFHRLLFLSYDVEQKPLPPGWHRHAESGTFSHLRSSFEHASLLPHCGLADAIRARSEFPIVAMLQNCCAVMAVRRELQTCALHVFDRARSSQLRILRSLQQVCRSHGQSLRIRAPPVSIRAALSAPAPRIAHVVILTCRCCSGCLFGGHAIWRQISRRRLVGRTGPCRRRMAGIRFSHVADRRR